MTFKRQKPGAEIDSQITAVHGPGPRNLLEIKRIPPIIGISRKATSGLGRNLLCWNTRRTCKFTVTDPRIGSMDLLAERLWCPAGTKGQGP